MRQQFGGQRTSAIGTILTVAVDCKVPEADVDNEATAHSKSLA